MLAIVIYFALIILLLIFPKSKFLYFISFAYLYILFAFNTNIADRGVYELRLTQYDTSMVGLTEPGFSLFMMFLNKLKIPLQGLYIIVASIYLPILSFIIRKLSKNPGFVLGGYMIFCFFYDVVQIRATTSLIFVYIGFYMLFTKKKKSVALFLIFVLIGGLFHSSALAFGLFALIKSPKKREIYIGIITLFAIIAIWGKNLMGNIVNIMGIQGKIDQVEQMNEDFYEGTNAYLVSIAFAILIVTPLLMSYYINKKRVKLDPYHDIAINLGIITIISLPLVYLSPDFRRLYFALWPIFLIFLSNWLTLIKNKSSIYLPFIICASLAFYRSLIKMNTNEILYALFQNNLLF